MEVERLNIKIADLPFSADLKKIVEEQRLATLRELLDQEVFQWHLFPCFTHHMEMEIVNYLSEHQLMDYIKE